MIEKILKAKHWQIFLLIVEPPFLIELAIMGSFDSKMATIAILIVAFLYMLELSVWLWAIAIGLQNKLPEEIKMKVGLFKIFFIIAFSYIVLISLVITFAFDKIEIDVVAFNKPSIALIAGIFIVFHLFVTYCLFYCLYFVAKVFKTVELQRKTTVSDFALDFLLFGLFPIGLWLVQPKINQMMK